MKANRTKKIWQRLALGCVTLCVMLCLCLTLWPQEATAAVDSMSAVSEGTMVISLSGLKGASEVTNASGTYMTTADYIYFGKYNGQPMLWRVLSKDTDNAGNAGGVFMISENLWRLNSAGLDYDAAYLSGLSAAEQAALLSPDDIADYTDGAGTYFGKDFTSAKPTTSIFAISAEEAYTYLSQYSGAPSLIGYTDATRAEAGGWWLRSTVSGETVRVSSDGAIDVEAQQESAQYYERPATNLDLSSVIYSKKVGGGWQLAVRDPRYTDPDCDFRAFITDINGTEIEISYINALLSEADGALGEYISAIITDKNGNVKYYGKLGAAPTARWTPLNYPAKYTNPGQDFAYQDSVTFDVAGLYDGAAGDEIYVFFEKTYDEATLAISPELAYETTTASTMSKLCWHEEGWAATCNTYTICGKCGTYYGGVNIQDLDAHRELLRDYYTGDPIGYSESTLTWSNFVTGTEDGLCYGHVATCSKCHYYLPVDENGFKRSYCVNSEQSPDCTTSVICDGCGLPFWDPDDHDFDENGLCTKNITHFEEPVRSSGNYRIETVGNLIWYAGYINGLDADDYQSGAVLMGDIDFSVLEDYADFADYSWTPIGTDEVPYSGVFNGNGFTIKNLNCVAAGGSDRAYVAFFGVVGKGQVQDLGIVSSYFENGNSTADALTAALAAVTGENAVIDGCYVADTMVKATTARVAGLVCSVANGEAIHDCYAVNMTVLQGEEDVGNWIFRDCARNTVERCFAYGYGANISDDTDWANCYYLLWEDMTSDDPAAMTRDRFASGEVAYLLGQRFGQTLDADDEDSYPIIGGDKIYQVEVCGVGLGYSNTDKTTHRSGGNQVCGQYDICAVCGVPFGQPFEHEYTTVVAYVWEENCSACYVRTSCERCGRENPELLEATVGFMSYGGVRAEYTASIYLDGNLYTSEPVRYIVIEIQTMFGVEQTTVPFTGQYIWAGQLLYNTRLQANEFEAYFMQDGEYVDVYALEAGTYDVHIVGRGNYQYQEYTFEDLLVITPVTVNVTVSVPDRIYDGTKDYELVLDFEGECDYSDLIEIDVLQTKLPSAEVGEYTITDITLTVDHWLRDSLTLVYNETAVARILPRNYASADNIDYRLEYTYGETVPEPTVANFRVDAGSTVRFVWYKDGVKLPEAPQDAGTYTLALYCSATEDLIAGVSTFEVTVHRRQLTLGFDIPEDTPYVDDKYDNRWYILEAGQVLEPVISGFVNGDTFESTGMELYWNVYDGLGAHQDSLGIQGFPTAMHNENYYIRITLHEPENFGTKHNYASDSTASIYVILTMPAQEVRVEEIEHHYDGTNKSIDLIINYDKVAFSEEVLESMTGLYYLDYRTTFNTDGNFDDPVYNKFDYLPENYLRDENGNKIMPYIHQVSYIDDNYASYARFRLTQSIQFYARTTASYGYYTESSFESGSQIIQVIRVTVSITDENGNPAVIREIGDYTVTVTTEYLTGTYGAYEVIDTKTTTSTITVVPHRTIWIFVKECEMNLNGSIPAFDIRDIKLVPGYPLMMGHSIQSVTYNVLTGYAGSVNVGEITVSDWVIVDEEGNDVSDWYTVKTTTYDLPNGANYYWSHTSGGDNVIHLYSNACDTTCNVAYCTVTRTVEPHHGGTATCSEQAICDICDAYYGGYDRNNHVSENTIYIQDQDDFSYHNKVKECCGEVELREQHTVTKAATCVELAECALCGVVEGSYDYTKHVSEDCGYAQNPYREGLHDYVHTCCGQVISTEAHTEGAAPTCTHGTLCAVCGLYYGDKDPEHHASEELTYTPNTEDATRHDIYHACCGVWLGKLSHSGGLANCVSGALCEGCGNEYAEKAPAIHASEDVTYTPTADGSQHDKSHACCGVYIATEAHSGGTATCTEPATCVCGAKYGATLPHTDADENDLCDVCGADISEGLSAGAIVGISVGSAAVAGVGGFSIFWFAIKKKSWADLLVAVKKINPFKKKVK